MIFSSLITRTNREEQRVAVALLSSPLPSWWSRIQRHFSGFAFSLSSRCDKYREPSPGSRLERAGVTSAVLGGSSPAQPRFSTAGIADTTFTPWAANQDILLVLRCVRCDWDAQVCLLIAFICRLEFPFCNKSHTPFFVLFVGWWFFFFFLKVIALLMG